MCQTRCSLVWWRRQQSKCRLIGQPGVAIAKPAGGCKSRARSGTLDVDATVTVTKGRCLMEYTKKIPAEAVELYTQFIHGEISRRDFLSGVQRFAVAGLTAGAIVEALMPNYALG